MTGWRRGVTMLLMAGGVALTGKPALASLVSFDVTADNGPFPNAIVASGGFYATQSVTFYVAPDQDQWERTGNDATIGYTTAFQPVSYSQCIYSGPMQLNICAGSIFYQVTGLVDTGVSGNFAVGGNSVEPFGQSSGIIGLNSGTYTVTATAYTAYNGPVAGDILMPSGSAGSTTATFTVQSGTVGVTPEPGGAGVFSLGCLLIAGRWFFGKGKRAAGCPLSVSGQPSFSGTP
jgi:hypothetical protein